MTLELVPWRGRTVPLLSAEVSRASLQDYLGWVIDSQRYMGPPAPITTYGTKAAEPISSSYEGFTLGMLYADGPVAAVEAYRLRVFGQAPLLFQELVDGRAGDWFDDDALDRLRAPWPGATLTDLMKRALVYGDLGGNAFVLDLEDELVLARPDWVEIVLARRMFRGGQVGWKQVGIVYYEGGLHSSDGVAFLPGEYAHFVPGLPDPLANYRGMSWLTPLIREVQADKSASEHKVAFFENAASPNLAVSLPKEITPTQFRDFVDKMDDQHRGAVNAYKTLYTAGGADVTVVGANMQQMDFSAVQGKGETRVANAGGVPPTLLSFSEGMQGSSLNAGNYTAAKRNFVDTTMRDLWGNWAGSLQQMDAFAPPRAKTRLWYDGRDVPFLHEDAKDLADIQQTQAATLASHIAAGWTPETARTAVITDDLAVLEHSGLMSVQLQEPGTADPNADPNATADVAADEYAQALDEFRSELVWFGDEILRDDFYDIRVRKGAVGGGRFRKLSDIAAERLNDWLNGKGDRDDPLADFTPGVPWKREQLRQAAKDLKVPLRRGATLEEIKLALFNDARERFRASKDQPKPSAKFTLKGAAHRNTDVAVYQTSDGKVALYAEDDRGRRGDLVAKADDLAGLESWASEHGESELAGWARQEQGGSPAVKKAAPAKRAPAKKAAPTAPAGPSLMELGAAIKMGDQKYLSEADPRIAEAVHGMFDGEFGPGLTAEVNDHLSSAYRATTEDGLIISAEGVIKNSDGKIVGSFRRMLRPEAGTVHNDTLAIAAQYQRQGFAKEFTANAERHLADAGFTRITVSPSAAGGVAWADFDWNHDKAAPAGDVPSRVGHLLTEDPNLSAADRAKLSDWQNRFRGGDTSKWPSPREIADAGPLGDKVMNGASWQGSRAIRGGAPEPAKKATPRAAKAAPPIADHVAAVQAIDTEDGVRQYLQDSKLTTAQLKALGNELGGPAAGIGETNRQRVIDRIAAGTAGLKDRPASIFSGDWSQGPRKATAPSSPVELDEAEKARRRAILEAPRPESGPLRPEGGIGALSTDPRMRQAAADALADIPTRPFRLPTKLTPDSAPRAYTPRTAAESAARRERIESTPAADLVNEDIPDAMLFATGYPSRTAEVQAEINVRKADAGKDRIGSRDDDFGGVHPEADAALGKLLAAGGDFSTLSDGETRLVAQWSLMPSFSDQANDELGRRGLDHESWQRGAAADVPAVPAKKATKAALSKATPSKTASPAVDVDTTLADLRGMRSKEDIRDALDLRKIDGPDGLKALLAAEGLAKTGRKRDLVDRLTDHLHTGDETPLDAPEPLSSDPAIRAVQVETRIRDAYAAVLARNPDSNSRWVGLADIRAELGEDVNRREVDAALRRLEQADGVNIVPESNQKTLRQADRDAAVTIGDQQKHAIIMDDPTAPDEVPIDEMTEAEILAEADAIVGTPSTPRQRAIADNAAAIGGNNAPAATAPAAMTDGEVEWLIRDAYNQVARRPGSLVSLADVRADLGEVPRDQVDRVLKAMSRTPSVSVLENHQMRDAAAAVVIGGQEKHGIVIDTGFTSDDVRPPAGWTPRAVTSTATDPDVEQRIRQTYARLARKERDFVSLTKLRAELPDVPRDQMDRVLTLMNRTRTVSVVPESDQGGLSEADHAAAVTIGNQYKHLITISDPSPRPLPDEPRPKADGGQGSSPAKTAARAPAKPVVIRDLFDADDATIETALRDVYEGQLGPYTTKVKVYITRTGTKVDRKGRESAVEPSIGVDGKIYDAQGHEIGYFGRSISRVNLHYADGVVRREVWAEHQIVQLGDGEDKSTQGKGFGGEFNRRAIEWYRASGVHGISQSDHNGYVWASQGFGFNGGIVPDHLVEDMRTLIADLRAGKTKSEATKDEYQTIPKRFREAPDLGSQITAAEALLARLESTKPGEPDYPTAYEISQLGRRAGQRGKTSLWLGKLLWVSAGEMILNPDEDEVISE